MRHLALNIIIALGALALMLPFQNCSVYKSKDRENLSAQGPPQVRGPQKPKPGSPKDTEKGADNGTEKSTEKSTEKGAENSAENSAHKSVDKSVDKSEERGREQAIARPISHLGERVLDHCQAVLNEQTVRRHLSQHLSQRLAPGATAELGFALYASGLDDEFTCRISLPSRSGIAPVFFDCRFWRSSEFDWQSTINKSSLRRESGGALQLAQPQVWRRAGGALGVGRFFGRNQGQSQIVYCELMLDPATSGISPSDAEQLKASSLGWGLDLVEDLSQ